MKTKYIYTAGWIALLCTLFSCADMTDTEREFLDKGEKIYAAKIDSAFALSGNMRQQIDIYYSSPRIVRGQIIYNLGQDTLHFSMPTDGRRKFAIMIDDLEETEYNYTVYTFDKDGNISLPIEISGRVYGRLYSDYLIRRVIENINLDDAGNTVIKWKTLSESEGVNFSYINKEDQKKSIYIPSSENTVTIADAKVGSEFSYTTTYRPNTTAIDSLESLPITGKIPYYQAKMELYNLPGNTPDAFGWVPSNLFDGNIESGYHTNGYSLPQQLSFKANKSGKLHSFKIYQRSSNHEEGNFSFRNGNPRKYTLLATNTTPESDGSDNGWTVIGSYESKKPSGLPLGQLTDEDIKYAKAGEEYIIDSEESYQYYRLKVTEVWNGKEDVHYMELQFFIIPE